MINIGINGFGRIGKCVFLQLLNNVNFSIKCLNATEIKVSEIEDYLNFDTTHKHNIKIKVEILSNQLFKINNHVIHLISERDAKKIDWKKMDCEYIIDATGSYLTTEKCLDHNADYVIMSSPPKDNTPTFIVGANQHLYNGEKIVSGSSCTTNCIAPILRLLNDNYGIDDCVFTTIHAATASQYVVDVLKKSSRTNRSIFNNIIPHTTGASSSVTAVLPVLEGKINGTSVRVPVVNCSLVDLNVELSNKNVTLKDISQLIKNEALHKIVYDVSDKKLVSGDFVTTTTPTILDINASIDMGNGRLKLMVWYDNEWSYSSQLIRLVEKMVDFNKNTIKEKYFVGNMDLTNKGVVCRFDFNVPTDHSGNVTDDFRISSSIETIKLILSKNPKYIVLTSHFGRPNGIESKYSLEFIVPILEKYLNKSVTFLKNGLSSETVETIEKRPEGIYLLENIRFHKEETDYEKGLVSSDNVVFNIYKSLGDVFISDAFGCLHRKHLSICAMRDFGKPYGYGILIKKELDAINSLINNKDKKVLGIIGGAKIKDKLPIIQSLKKIPNSSVFIGGALAKQYTIEDKTREFVPLSGYGNKTLTDELTLIEDIYSSDMNVYDISIEGFLYLKNLLSDFDIIFWNGSLGVIEDNRYAAGSISLLNTLKLLVDKTIIIGGGETASLVEDKNKNPHIYVSTGGGALLEHLQNKILYNSNLVGLEIFV
jgi:glyceraldehyde 3-phosphate dehydrogenase